MLDMVRVFVALALSIAAFPAVVVGAGAPWWLAFPAFVAAVLALNIWLDRPLECGPEQAPKGLCVECGYNLTGNVSGVCPECGRRVA